MKTIIYLTCFFILFITNLIIPQNWLPLEVGNKWEYLRIELRGTFTVPDTDYFNASIYYNEVLSDTTINNTFYYNFSQNPENWFRFSEFEQKIFYWWENEDKLVMDFSLPADSFFITYLPNPTNQEAGANVISGDYWLFDTLFSFKGYLWYLVVDGLLGQSVKYIPDHGLVYDSLYYYDNASLQYQILIRKLVQANISGNNFRGKEVPEIIVEPIYSIADSNFFLRTIVNHSYNILFPMDSSFTGLNYIDSVYLHSFYSKNDSTVYNQTISAINIEETEIWNINTTLNMDLLKDDFNFYYKIEAVDKGLVPCRSFAPDSGYFVAVYDTTSGIVPIEEHFSSFSLSQNYPNPFNPTTKIKFTIPKAPLSFGEGLGVRLIVYDVLGNEIATLVNEEKPAGDYEVEFDGNNLPSGVYFYQLRTGNFIETKKMMMLR